MKIEHPNQHRNAATPHPAITLDWQWAPYAALSAEQVYAMLTLRQQVFVLEQRCLFADIDQLDQAAFHLFGWQSDATQLIAYLRCVVEDFTSSGVPRIVALGRIVCAQSMRGRGIGRQLVSQGIQHAQQQFAGCELRLNAQSQLENFYRSFGFIAVGEPYDEDGILHVGMGWTGH